MSKTTIPIVLGKPTFRELLVNGNPGDYLCMMNPWSGCGAILNDEVKDQSSRQYSKCGTCPTCYAVLQRLWSDPELKLTRKQMEEAGMIRPPSRQTEKRVIETLLLMKRTD